MIALIIDQMPVVVQGTNITTATGKPVVLVDGDLYVVDEVGQ